MMKISKSEKTDKSTSEAALASLVLSRQASEPLNVQLTSEFKRLILHRILPSGSKLPASRAYAEELGVSRVTVVAAIDQLIAEGYAEGRHGSGVYVASDLPEHVLKAPGAAAGPVEDALPPPERIIPFRHAAPETRLFPHETWTRLFQQTWRIPADSLRQSPDPLGWAPLRQAIATHLRAFRGMQCAAAQVIVTSGANEAVEIIAKTLLAPGDAVFIEDPGYPSMWSALQELNLEAIHVPIDEEGFAVAAAGREARAALITPSRHFPTGVTMPLARRLSLLDWACRREAWIIEDDYDSEYRYHGQPLPALMSLDGHARAIYVGSFSKTTLPGLRLGFLVVPSNRTDDFARTVHERGVRASLMMQPVLASFIAEGHYATHIRRMRRLYAKRQAALIDALDRHARGILAAKPEAAGMHLVASLANGMDDREAEERAGAAGIFAAALSDYFVGRPFREGLLLGYAGFDEETIVSATRRLADTLR